MWRKKIPLFFEFSKSEEDCDKNIWGNPDFLFLITAYIVCVYEDPIVPEQAASVTEKLGDYLIQVGF